MAKHRVWDLGRDAREVERKVREADQRREAERERLERATRATRERAERAAKEREYWARSRGQR